MKKLTLIISLLLPFCLFAEKKLIYTVDSIGLISYISIDGKKNIEFRKDEFAGPTLWLNNSRLPIGLSDNAKGIYGQNDSVSYRIEYKIENEKLQIKVTCKNLLNERLKDVQLSLRLGIDTEMAKYPHWHDVFFPTLMRCEKTHFWGYLMTPLGRILTVSSPDAIASYHLHYNNSKHKISFGNGHRIRTVSLDLLNPGPLPERHPQNLSLKAGETRSWTIYFQEVKTLDDIPASVSVNSVSPVLQADYYTLPVKGKSSVRIFSASVPKVSVATPDGDKLAPRVKRITKNVYGVEVSLDIEGVYILTATNQKGKQTEMKLSAISDRYSDYIKAARLASLKYQQKTNTNAECWYGLFSGFIARQYFPDSKVDAEVEKVFNQINKVTFNLDTHLPLNNPMRIQDTALKAALWAQYYRATGNISYLRWAADLADFIMTTQLKWEWDTVFRNAGADGAYRSGKTHYTSVIYIAKGIMEVMKEEKALMTTDNTGEWEHRYNRHYASVKMAMDELAKNLDNIQTEGEMTFEDGMISCSYTQLSEFALLQPEGSEARKYYTEAAEKMANMHRCLSQIIIPDSRMNGGSLRFWEAQYDILTMPNMMNSPHGWSAWRIYGLRNLYLLTGKYDYLRQMINSIGSCIQLINPQTSELNWAFVQDPYLKVQRFVPDENKPGRGKHVEQVIGEQYMSMISDWYKADTMKMVSSFGRFDGGCCDNDVHEIFKCLGEVLLTSAYVHQLEDGSLVCHNCEITKENGKFIVCPKEDCINKVHFQLSVPQFVEVLFGEKKVQSNIIKGWIKR